MDTAPTEPSRITILQAPGHRQTKTYARDRAGKVTKRSYDTRSTSPAEVREFHGVDGLAELLRELQHRPDACVIRAEPGRWHPGPGQAGAAALYRAGEFADGRGKFHKPAKKGAARDRQEADIAAGRLWPVSVLPTFEEQPTDWLLLDFDTVSAPAGVDWRDDLAWTAAYLRLQLPAEFHGARCVFYATSSAATLTKPDLGGDVIRMRLGFVLDRGVVFAEAKRWLAGARIDHVHPAARAGDIYRPADLQRRAGRPAARAPGRARRRARAGRRPGDRG